MAIPQAMAPIFQSLLALLACAVFGHAHNMQLKAHSRECFHEMLHADDRMTVTFQVGDREFGGSGNLDLDFWVRGFSSIGFIGKRRTRKGVREYKRSPCVEGVM